MDTNHAAALMQDERALWGTWYTGLRRRQSVNVTVNPKLARFVEEQVKAGRFSTPEDVVNGALARLQTEQELSETEVASLRAQVALGIEQADRGELMPWDPGAIETEVERRARAQARSNPPKKS